MFTLVKMKDAIPIPADKLDKPRAVAVSHQIEDKYCNRVLLEVGLCVCLHELTELGDGLIYQSDASVHVRAEFTYETSEIMHLADKYQSIYICTRIKPVHTFAYSNTHTHPHKHTRTHTHSKN